MNDVEWENLLASISQAEASSSTERPQPEPHPHLLIVSPFDSDRPSFLSPQAYVEPPPLLGLPLNSSLTDQEFFAQFSQSLPPSLLPRHLTEPTPTPTHYTIIQDDAQVGPSHYATYGQSAAAYPSTEAARELSARARAGRGRGRVRRTTTIPPRPGTSHSSNLVQYLG